VVVVTKEVTEPMDGQVFEFAVQAGAAGTAAGGLHRDHDVAEKDAITCRIVFTPNFLHVEAQHVGGAVEATELAIEGTDLVIAGEHQGSRRSCAPQPSQGHAQEFRDVAARGHADQAAGSFSDDEINGHVRSRACRCRRPRRRETDRRRTCLP
jgi:hypothetical protein